MHKLSVQTADWYNYLFGENENPEAAFRFIRECGFDAVDYNIDHTMPPFAELSKGIRNDYYDAPVEEILSRFAHVKAAAEKTGVSFAQAHAPFPMHVDDQPEHLEYMLMVVEKILAVCQYIGCPALVVHPIKDDDPDRQWERNLAMYRRLIPAGKKYGVKICLENLNGRQGDHTIGWVCADGEEVCRYIDLLNKEAGAEVFGFCLDIGHANMASRNIRRFIRTLGHRLTCLHIHDNDGVWDLHQFPYTSKSGQNRSVPNLDWEGFLAGLRDIGYQGDLNFETFGALLVLPRPLFEPALRYLGAIGKYFREQIQ